MSELTGEALNRLIELSRETGAQEAVGNTAYAVIPGDCKIEDLTRFIDNDRNPAPIRIKASVTVLDPESFCEYHKVFADDATRIFASEPARTVLAIFDYHESSDPHWCQHRATLKMQESEPWKVWLGANNKKFSQSELSEFLEQNVSDVVQPSPASMMEVARDLQATTEVQFGSGLRQQDGQVKFKYTEETRSTVGGSSITVPEQFVLSIPVFVGGAAVSMQALLRFRMKEGHLTFFYTLIRPEDVIRRAFLEARNQIASTLGVTIINGSPA